MDSLASILRCPRCFSTVEMSDVALVCGDTRCLYGSGESSFPIVDGQPVLIDFEQSLFDRVAFTQPRPPAPPGGAALGSSLRQRLRRLRKRLLRGANQRAAEMAGPFLREAKAVARPSGDAPRILIVGGGTAGSGSDSLYRDPEVEVVGTDVYASPLTLLVSDGHRLPFEDASFDGVWIQAVLEHVLEPAEVVSEIHRVLRPEAVVYAETPFMQQVHMGAFDFTRFTLSGHRWLFRRFEQLDAGVSGGAGVATIWSLRYLARALGAGSTLAGAVAAPFFWLRFLDPFTASRVGADAASGIFFFGRKSDKVLHPKDMPGYYESCAGSGAKCHG